MLAVAHTVWRVRRHGLSLLYGYIFAYRRRWALAGQVYLHIPWLVAVYRHEHNRWRHWALHANSYFWEWSKHQVACCVLRSRKADGVMLQAPRIRTSCPVCHTFLSWPLSPLSASRYPLDGWTVRARTKPMVELPHLLLGERLINLSDLSVGSHLACPQLPNSTSPNRWYDAAPGPT